MPATNIRAGAGATATFSPFSPRLMRSTGIIRMSGTTLAHFLAHHANPCLRVSQLPPMLREGSGGEGEGEGAEDIRTRLHRECSELPLGGDKRALLTWLIECVNDEGYLELPDELPLAAAELEAGIRELQAIAAPGIAARSVAERLLLLLAQTPQTPVREQAEHFVRAHWDALTRKRWDRLPRRLQQPALALIQSLPPPPLPAAAAAALIPDVLFVFQRGFWQAQAAAACAIRVSAKKSPDAGAGDWQRADEIAAAVRARRRFVLAAAQLAADRQSAFFRAGAGALRPLPHAEAAAALAISPAMLSHIISGKQGIFSGGQFPLKYLYGCHTFSRVIQHHLQQIISNENQRHPLSDSQLCAQLRRRGIPLARRTVTKHRHQIGIAAAARRKRADG